VRLEPSLPQSSRFPLSCLEAIAMRQGAFDGRWLRRVPRMRVAHRSNGHFGAILKRGRFALLLDRAVLGEGCSANVPRLNRVWGVLLCVRFSPPVSRTSEQEDLEGEQTTRLSEVEMAF
jgi:hypothetical protein